MAAFKLEKWRLICLSINIAGLVGLAGYLPVRCYWVVGFWVVCLGLKCGSWGGKKLSLVIMS